MLEAIGLTRTYGSVAALRELDLNVAPGELYCLLGANGAGKTTTIHLFLGFIAPSSGVARVGGIDVAKSPVEAKRRLAYVPEQVSLYGHFTARENLEFFARLNGVDSARDALYRMMADVGLAPSSFERPVRTFSKGMRQRLVLAIAIAKRTDALLLDEPTSGLDPLATAELFASLRRLRDRGHAILMSTHDVFHSKELADRVGMLRGGRLVAEHTRDELKHIDLEDLYLEQMKVQQ